MRWVSLIFILSKLDTAASHRDHKYFVILSGMTQNQKTICFVKKLKKAPAWQ